MQTAAIVLIGDELLSGKVRDVNAEYLIPRLRALGVALRRVAIVPDERAAIEDEVRRAAALADVVFTSGGVGPTHDDVTIECIASAFGVPVVRHPELDAMLRQHFGERLRPDHLRMADVPEGTELIQGGELRWPVVKFRNVYILPGIPEIFRRKFDAIAERFRSGAFHLRCLYLNADEGSIAQALRDTQATHAVAIGSYPRIDAGAEYRVRVTVESREPEPVNAAVDALVRGLPPESLVRVDPVV